MLRRTPIYLLLDCSESMAGERIQTVGKAIRELHNEYMGDTQICISIITFNSEQIGVFPLKELAEFEPPKLKVSGTAALGTALELVTARAETEEQKGDWNPWVFIISAFEPTDDWKKGLAKFQLYNWGYVVGCAVDGADSDGLERIAEVAHVELNTEGASLTERVHFYFNYFNERKEWPIDEFRDYDDDVELPPPPQEIQIHPAATPPNEQNAPPQPT